MKWSGGMKMKMGNFGVLKWMVSLKCEFCCTEVLILYESILNDEADSDRASIFYRVIF